MITAISSGCVHVVVMNFNNRILYGISVYFKLNRNTNNMC